MRRTAVSNRIGGSDVQQDSEDGFRIPGRSTVSESVVERTFIDECYHHHYHEKEQQQQ